MRQRRLSRRITNAKQLWLTAILATAVAAPMANSAEDNSVTQPTIATASRLPIEGGMPSFAGATGWLNSPPLTAAELRGKVVLVEFWTYSCINWLRTLPYVRAWAAKYRDQGLVVIGVHTPEFPFEKDLDNIGRAAKGMRIDYPIAVDSDYGIWHAFNNDYWPALYFIDAQGRIRHHYYGEGEYEQSERVIQQLLAEAGKAGGNDLVSVDASGAEAAADWADLKSPETYLGYERAENFASPGRAASDKPRDYTAPTRLSRNHWGLAGNWTIGAQQAVLNEGTGRITYRFHARDLHLVLASSSPDHPIRFRVTLDGAPPEADHGLDVDAEGRGSVQEARLYQLIRQTRPVADRTFEIEFLDPGVRAYVFTFG